MSPCIPDGKRLLQVLKDAVKPRPKPAVFLSGGLDSAIILHHLTEKTKEEIYTYTLNLDEHDFERGSIIAEHYGSTHRNIEVKNVLPTIARLQAHLDRPRWNLWPYWGYYSALNDGRETVYIGEGMDEHFGGYWYKPKQTYQEYWTSVLAWSIPTHTQIAYLLGLDLEMPFLRLDVRETRPFWDEEDLEKTFLRQIYKGVIPDFILERKKTSGRINFLDIWEAEIAPHLRYPEPQTLMEAYKIINKWTIERWLESH